MTVSEFADRMQIVVLEPRSTYDRALLCIQLDDPPRAVYSGEACIEVLMAAEGWDYEEASEWVDYNVVGACVGAGYPLIVWEEGEDDV